MDGWNNERESEEKMNLYKQCFDRLSSSAYYNQTVRKLLDALTLEVDGWIEG